MLYIFFCLPKRESCVQAFSLLYTTGLPDERFEQVFYSWCFSKLYGSVSTYRYRGVSVFIRNTCTLVIAELFIFSKKIKHKFLF